MEEQPGQAGGIIVSTQAVEAGVDISAKKGGKIVGKNAPENLCAWPLKDRTTLPSVLIITH
jgi:hypothetical protein